ncbi:hypothetical protein OZX60_03820 [Streptococcaceae bacterium ESL0687]|nr:hypothetical protein OZX60_03820 [Streptococcaceae bacterium ESL0687]
MKFKILFSLLIALFFPLADILNNNLPEEYALVDIFSIFIVVYFSFTFLIWLLTFLGRTVGLEVYQYLRTKIFFSKGRDSKKPYISLKSQMDLIHQFYDRYNYVLDCPYIVDQKGAQGALIYLTRRKLSSHLTQRELVRLPDPPGWKRINNSRAGRVYPYHRTHLLPFIFSQSEGFEMPFLLITGSSYLNHGDLLSLDTITSHDRRDYNSIYNRAERIKLNNRERKILVNQPTLSPIFDGSLKYSLADVEAYTSEYIEKSKGQHVFCYMVTCNYDEDPLIPASVNIFFQNVSLQKTILNMELENIHL